MAAATGNARWLRAAQMIAPFALLALVWQIAAWNLPPFLFPSLAAVFKRVFEILTTWSEFVHVLATVARILAGLAGAFVLGAAIAIAMARSRAVDLLFAPLLNFFQGIPALSWVVFAIIWFKGTEERIFFIMLVTSLPSFAFQTLGALRAVPKDLFEMVLSFRPTKFLMFRAMILPAILPEILTAWKVNLGNASRVAVVAELVGATGGVGYALLQQQQLFDMAGAMAWTLQLVFFVLLTQAVLNAIEARAFRYRAVSEHAL